MKLNTLLLVTIMVALNTMSVRGALHELPTGKPGLTCSVRPLTMHEAEWLFFKDKALRYTKDLMIWGAYQQDTSGTLLYLSQQENHDFLKHMYEQYEPVEVIIKNESNDSVTIPRASYLKSYARAVVATEEFIKQYPNFKKHTVLASLYAAGIGLFAVPIASACATFIGLNIYKRLRSRGGNYPFSVWQNLLVGGFGMAVLVPFILTASFAGRASALHKKYSQLRSLAPKLKTDAGSIIPLPKAAEYTIPPRSSFVDTLILYRPHMNTVFSNHSTTSEEPALATL